MKKLTALLLALLLTFSAAFAAEGIPPEKATLQMAMGTLSDDYETYTNEFLGLGFTLPEYLYYPIFTENTLRNNGFTASDADMSLEDACQAVSPLILFEVNHTLRTSQLFLAMFGTGDLVKTLQVIGINFFLAALAESLKADLQNQDAEDVEISVETFIIDGRELEGVRCAYTISGKRLYTVEAYMILSDCLVCCEVDTVDEEQIDMLLGRLYWLD